MLRYEIVQRKTDEVLLVAGGVVFPDNVTFLRWTDGSGAMSIYPNYNVLYGITAEEGEIIINWLDGEPADIPREENHTHEHR